MRLIDRNLLSILMATLIVGSSPVIALAKGTKIAIDPAKQNNAADESFRHKQPNLPSPRPFKLAAITSYTLSNGLSVQLLPDHRVPFITAVLGVNAGSTLDPKDLLGLTGITADMLNEGTNTKTSKQIADEIDFIGGALGAAAGHDNTIINASALSKYSDRLLDILSDVILHPNFPDDELKLKKANLIQELEIKRSEPDFLVDERFSKATFGNHPYSVIAPTKDTVTAITRESLQNFHNKYYLPNRSYLVVVGDFDLEKMKSLIESKFNEGWQKNEITDISLPATPKAKGQSIYLVDRPESVQSSIKLGNISIKKTDPDYFPFLVSNQVLGGATNSRLFLNIREQKGFTYGAYSGVGARKEPGAFAAQAEVRTEVTALALEEFLYELDRLRKVKVSDKELADAKSYLAGSFQLALETQSGLAGKLLERKLYGLPEDYLETYVDKIMAVTPDQVREMARKHIDLDNIIICVVGDAAKIKPELQYFAAVDVYDTSGNPENLNKRLESSSIPTLQNTAN